MPSFMNNRTIARYLRLLASLLEVQKEHHPLSATYRKAADQIRALRNDLADTPEVQPLGISRTVWSVVQQLMEHSLDAAFEAASISVPKTLCEILKLPGIGAHTTYTLYHSYHIQSLEQLQEALIKHQKLPLSDAIRATLPKEIIALQERERRVPLRLAESATKAIMNELAILYGVTDYSRSGSVRRRDPLSDHVLVLASVKQEDSEHVQHALLTKNYAITSVDDWVQDPIRILLMPFRVYFRTVEQEDHIVPVNVMLITPQKWAIANVYLSGDQLHNEALQLLIENRTQSDDRKPPQTEHEVYASAGLPYIIPLLRDGLSMTKDPQTLVDHSAIKGDLHMHTTYSDGHDALEDMVKACIARGYSYLTISDHSQGLTVANGLSYDRLLKQHEEILCMREKYPQIMIFHGSEVDITANARLDFPDSVLEQLDFVVASIHTAMRQSKAELTARALYAIQSPYVHILAHPTGRMLGRRDSFALDFDRVFSAAREHNVAIECNSNPERLDLDPLLLRRAMEAGCLFSIDSDAHAVENLMRIEQYGIDMAKKGWLTTDRVINTWPLERLTAWMAASRNPCHVPKPESMT